MANIYNSESPDIIIRDLDHIFVEEVTSNVITIEAVVAYDGSIILPNIGKLQVTGKTLKDIESSIESLPQLNTNNWKNFQIQVTGFNSQKAIISIENREVTAASSSQLIPITDAPLDLLEAIMVPG